MLAHTYNVIINSGVGSTGHEIEFVDGLNDTEKRFLSMLMTTVKFPGAEAYDPRMEINTSTVSTDISLAREFQKNFHNQHLKME